MTKAEYLSKMNARHGTDIGDYFMMLVWLRRAQERCERKGYIDQATDYRADRIEMLRAEITDELEARKLEGTI